ncbi:MAG: chemotaxis protein CheB [Rhodanobacter sp.]
MIEAAPAVALLFDDTELGGQLREALHERGARIVHEGGVSSLSRELLQQSGAEVVVVNLDNAADDALDQLYEVIDGDQRPRIVFNDAQASRALVGWDRARWARHLAVKVLAAGDVDPPRPENARRIEAQPTASIEALPVEAAPVEAPAQAAPVEISAAVVPVAAVLIAEPTMAEVSSLPEPDLPVHEYADEGEQTVTEESESLAAELEALLASDELPAGEEDDTGPGLRYAHDEELPPLHDGNFGVPAAVSADHSLDGLDRLDGFDESTPSAVDDLVEKPSSAPSRVFQLDHLQLSPMDDAEVATIAAVAVAHIPSDSMASAARAHDEWSLLDDETPLAASTEVVAEEAGAAAFGIEKLSAADFLAPDVEQTAAGFEPTMSLQLVSMEEAIAPQAYVAESEMLLDDLSGALSRIVVLGAAIDSTESVCAFLGALPATTRLTLLHTQHLGGKSAQALVEALAERCTLPVRLAEHGGRAGVGEILVVPTGQQVRLHRNGTIELAPGDTGATQAPSIDDSLTMAANIFGRDALAIVFAGRSTDAVAGSQAIHDRGGQVWVESSSETYSADMVSGLFAERLVSFSGTPHELAARLIEVYP